MATRLPELRAGIYRHYKGPLYQVLGYAHDANADALFVLPFAGVAREPLGERFVVVYIGLELTEAHTGPRLAVRTADDFFAWLHQDDFTICPRVDYVQARVEYPYCSCSGYWFAQPTGTERRQVVQRFTYVGANWEGDHG